MEWLNLHTSTLDADELSSADDTHRSTWLHLTRYCIGQENGGRIKGAKNWNSKRWIFTARVDFSVIEQSSPLWSWSGEDLVVWGYPREKQRQVQQNRESGRKGGLSRSKAKLLAAQQNGKLGQDLSHPSTCLSETQAPASSDTSTIAQANALAKSKQQPNGMEGEGEGNRNRKENRKGREGNGAQNRTSKPPLVDEVITYFIEAGSSENEARNFTDHFDAIGWVQGRARHPIRSWHAAANRWLRRSKGFEREKISNGGPGAAEPPFDPRTPNAHTGGVPVSN